MLDALFFAASLRGPGEFVTAAELAGETGLSEGELDACAQALQITRAGITALRLGGS